MCFPATAGGCAFREGMGICGILSDLLEAKLKSTRVNFLSLHCATGLIHYASTVQPMSRDRYRRQQESTWIVSRYNFRVPTESGVLLYNAGSGAVIRLDGEDGQAIADLLTRNVSELPSGIIPLDVLSMLRNGGFVVPTGWDERAHIQSRYWNARRQTPLVLTVTTTQDCNLGCFYCYEERTKEKLSEADVPSLVEFVRFRLQQSQKRSLHVDWYGGEPLLNVAFLEPASIALQQLCRDVKVDYHASVVSNGTCWPEAPQEFIRRHAIRQVQISFDGMREKHNRTRRYRSEYATPSESSFDRAVTLVDQLLDVVRVDIRLNLGSHNRSDLMPFLSMARERGWFTRAFPAVIQPARISAYSEQCGFLRPKEMDMAEFEELRQQIRDEVGSETLVEEPEAPDGLPLPRNWVCAALASDSAIVGADGLEYRCGLHVGQKERAVAPLLTSTVSHNDQVFPILGSPQEFPDANWWRTFDPTEAERCSSCSFLPICWGGCPDRHLRKDRHALEEQSAFWRANLPRLIASGVGTVPLEGFTYDEADQFRNKL